ncbi:MAG TPA: tetratricopeptide repeat protein [Gemmatimonadaceae bacterium]|nr:tetratricopeptide repeat protein [Gemmatimonadaceae bacterium]
MALKDPTAWMQDLTVYMDDEELAGTAEAMEPNLVPGGTALTTSLWIALMGVVAGALGGVTLSPAIRGSALTFIAFIVGAAVLLRGFHPLSRRLLGRGAAWMASQAFFWAFLLALFAVLGAQRESSLWAYVLSVGLGFFVGMMNGSLTPGIVRSEDIWMSVSFPMGAVSAGVATWVLRNTPLAADTLAGAALGGAIAGGLYHGVMAVALARLWSEAHGLGQMGLLYLHNDNFAPKAVAYLDRALALSPRDARLHNLRGIAWSKMDEPERAAEDWRRAAELLPNDAEPHLNLGADCLRRGDLDGAIEALHAALAVDPKYPTAHSNLGAAHERKGELEPAIEHYSKAVELDPDYANAYSNRAFAYHRRGDHERALADSDRAIALNPRLPMAHVNRAHALAALGRTGEAADSYRDAIDLDPEPSVREESLRGLERLGAITPDDEPV